ncbi:MAG: HNH endonuclease [Gammaproteobacteria bacterium]|nr:HNH endonuclease [Gammaproteobacteria bacterium]|tara:strand:+ start:255 stop:515 length:261 start_codon:yes stop_codon:yes gene_type:complete
MAKKRDYKKEYRDFHGKPKQIKLRNMRNAARNQAMKEGKVKKGDGKHIDHIKPLSKGGTNGKKNIRIVSAKTNLRKGAKYSRVRKK